MDRAHRKAQEKMQWALSSANNAEISDGSCSLTKKALEPNTSKASVKDPGVSAVILRNFDERYIILTFVALESDAHWQIILPLVTLQDPDQRNDPGSVANANMDRFVLVFPTSAVSLQVDQPKTQKGRLDRACSAKSLTNRILGSNVLGQSRNRALVNRRARLLKDSGNSSQQKSFVSSNCATSINDESDATWLDDLVNDKPLAEKPIKRSSRKKAKKKGKRRTTSSSLEALCEENVLETSFSEISTNNMVWEERSILNNKLAESEIRPEVLLQDNMVRHDGVDGNNCITNHASMPMMVSSYSDGVEASKATVPSVPQNLEHGDFAVSSMTEIGEALSSLKGEVADICPKPSHYSNVIASEDFFDECSSPILDPVYGDLNSNAGDGNDEQPTEKDDVLAHGPDKGYFSHGNLSIDGVDGDSCAARIKCNSPECNSSELHLFEPVKRRRKGRKFFETSSCVHKFSLGGQAHGHPGKENNSSVWQKVRRNNVDGYVFEPDTDSRYDIAPKELDASPTPQDGHKSGNKVSEKMKRKARVGLKQENVDTKKGYCVSETNSIQVIKMIKQEEILDVTSPMVDHTEGILTGSGSHCYIDCSRVRLGQSSRIDSKPSESGEDLHACVDEMNPIGGACTEVCDTIDHVAQNQNKLSSLTSELLARTHILEVNNAYVNLEAQERDHNSGSFPQKKTSVVRKDAAIAYSSGSDHFLMSDLDESVSDGWSLKNPEEEELNCRPSTNALEASGGSSSEDISSLHIDDEDQVAKLSKDTCVSEESSGTLVVTNCIPTLESKDHAISVFETDSNKIAQAVKSAYRIQLASEGVQLATGSPLAEFERFLQSAAPVLGQTHMHSSCQVCSRDQFFGASLCRHEMPNISLGSIWQWYEIHGNYGLEVRAEDSRTCKRMGIRKFEFSAYFVPYMSAIQLFRSSRKHSLNTSNGILSAAVRSHDMSVVSENSSSHSLGERCFDDSELLFEYFELEHPRQRRPLFEKIKELVEGDIPSEVGTYGDPAILDSLDLHDLHPASWYCVAWYPIYRIPDGKFSAAFLTYHSLGHLTRRSTSSDCFGEDIISPVVGLQRYKAEGECWFQPRHNGTTPTAEIPSVDCCQLLKDRCQTLEETACVMARGIVKKDNARCVNRHSDYEFFKNRRW